MEKTDEQTIDSTVSRDKNSEGSNLLQKAQKINTSKSAKLTKRKHDGGKVRSFARSVKGTFLVTLILFLVCSIYINYVFVSNLSLDQGNSENGGNSQIDLSRDPDTLIMINHNLISENEGLKNQVNDLSSKAAICNSPKEQILKYTAEDITSRVNSNIHIVWNDHGYLVQIVPDAKVGPEVEKLLADSIEQELKQVNEVKVQKIDGRTYFFTAD